MPSADPPTDINRDSINEPGFAPYRYKRPARAKLDVSADEPVPLFLSHPADEIGSTDEQHEPRSRWPIRLGFLAAFAAALAATLLSVNTTRDIIINAKASLIGTSSVEARIATPQAVQPIAEAGPVPPPPAVADAPSRAQIAAAYQDAIKSQVVAQALPPAAPPARRLDPDELGALMKRANGLLAVGDIVAARLLLERAADAEDADAALLLARTYDPDVLGAMDARSVKPDLAQARSWYRRAAEFGSQHAQQRLAQLPD